jgi:hypothetical protein
MSALVRSYKMENVTFIEVETLSGIVEYAIIDWGDGRFTSMTKAEYEKEYPSE